MLIDNVERQIFLLCRYIFNLMAETFPNDIFGLHFYSSLYIYDYVQNTADLMMISFLLLCS